MMVCSSGVNLVFWDWLNTLVSQQRIEKVKNSIKRHGIACIPYAWSLVNSFNAKGIKQVIVSNGSDEEIFEGLNIAPFRYFDLIHTTSTCKPKPENEMFLKALNQLNVKVSEAVFIGDNECDETAARNIGLKFFKVNNTLLSYKRIADEFGLVY